jgi:hypothetical protein
MWGQRPGALFRNTVAQHTKRLKAAAYWCAYVLALSQEDRDEVWNLLRGELAQLDEVLQFGPGAFTGEAGSG